MGAKRVRGYGSPPVDLVLSLRLDARVSEWTSDMRHNPESAEATARRLTESLVGNDSQKVWLALKRIIKGHNISAIARTAGMRRDTLYRSFSGKVDPSLSRVLKLLAALNIRLVAVASANTISRSRHVWIYVDRRYEAGDENHVKVFATAEVARDWLAKHDPEGVAFESAVMKEVTNRGGLSSGSENVDDRCSYNGESSRS